MLLPICWLWGIEKCHLWLWYHSWHIDFITRAFGTRDKFNVFTCDYHNHAWHFSMPQSQQIGNIPLPRSDFNYSLLYLSLFIGGLQLENNYALDFKPENGLYHLRISNATYDRDNGRFECRMKEGKTGKILHAQSFDLTVLLEPSPPTIRPANPTATEGRPFNLTCSSVGGSPPPQIKWYKLGKSTSIIFRDRAQCSKIGKKVQFQKY